MLYPLTRLRGAARGAIVLIVATTLLFGCSRSSDEQQLRDAMAAMQDAVERRDPSDFMNHVGEDFTAPDGGMDRRKIHDLLRLQVLRNERIGVTTVVRDLQADGSRATISMTATFTGSSGGWLPERGSVYTLTSGWRKDDGAWKLIHATWQRSL